MFPPAIYSTPRPSVLDSEEVLQRIREVVGRQNLGRKTFRFLRKLNRLPRGHQLGNDSKVATGHRRMLNQARRAAAQGRQGSESVAKDSVVCRVFRTLSSGTRVDAHPPPFLSPDGWYVGPAPDL